MFWKHPYCSQPLQVFSHWSHLARHRFLVASPLARVTSSMAITFCTASPLAWPSPLIQHHLSYGITSRMGHLLYGIIFRMAIISLIRHHISQGHHFSHGITSRMAIVRHHLSQILALLLPMYPLLQAELRVSCSSAGWTARQFKNTLEKFRILKKISTTKLLLLVRLLPGFSTNLS